jgi:hypothetical protein
MQGNHCERCVLDEEALLEVHRYLQERGGVEFPEERQALVQPDRPSNAPLVTVSERAIPPEGESGNSSNGQFIDEKQIEA